jgi:hypothetical protein
VVKEAPCTKRVPTAIIAALETNKRGFLPGLLFAQLADRL